MAKQTFTTGQVLTAAQMTSLQQTAMGGGSATAKTASYTLVAVDAGTTVIMNSASATTITVDTSLFAAGDTVFIQNIGSGVSTITPGTATVNTSASLALAQYEGGTLYFTSSSAALFFKADGAAPASTSGLTLINTTSFSAVSSQSLNSVFSSTYDNYKIIMDTDTSASNVAMTMRMRVGGADNSSANYVWDQGLATGNVQIAAETSASSPQTSWAFFGSGGIPSAHTWELYRPFETNNTGFTGLSYYIDSATGTNTNHIAFFRAGATTVTTSYDGFTFFVASGTMTGKVSVYGYAK